MNRRNFLLAGLTGLGLTSSQLHAFSKTSRWEEALNQSFCRTRPAELIAVSMPPRQPNELRYQGTHILAQGGFRDLASVYRGRNGGHLNVWGGGCDDGITTTRRGLADLGGMCCPVKGSRAEGMPWLLVAHDIKAVVAHPSNPATDVSMDELRALAMGSISNWKTLGGKDQSIALVVRKHCPDYFEPVRDILLKNRPDWSPKGLFVERDEQITDMVSRYEAGLGLVSWVFAKPFVEAGKLKLLTVNGYKATPANVRSKRYPLHGPLSVVFRRWEAASMRPFFDYLYSKEGKAVMARALVPVSDEEANYRPRRWT